jgi:hypothetical protein
MDSQEYSRLALTTESRPETLNFGEVGLDIALSIAIQSAKLLDVVKRAIFYSADYDVKKARQIGGELIALIDTFAEVGPNVARPNDRNQYNVLPAHVRGIHPGNVNLRLLHSALGSFTEGGELCELVAIQLETGELNPAKFAEELGDVAWYGAIGADALGVSLDSIRFYNISKLDKRYRRKGDGTGLPGFNTDSALNRDLAAEFKVLEGIIRSPSAANDATPEPSRIILAR